MKGRRTGYTLSAKNPLMMVDSIVSNETLCTKQLGIDTADYNEPVPCLACLDRLVKIEAKL